MCSEEELGGDLGESPRSLEMRSSILWEAGQGCAQQGAQRALGGGGVGEECVLLPGPPEHSGASEQLS